MAIHDGATTFDEIEGEGSRREIIPATPTEKALSAAFIRARLDAYRSPTENCGYTASCNFDDPFEGLLVRPAAEDAISFFDDYSVPVRWIVVASEVGPEPIELWWEQLSGRDHLGQRERLGRFGKLGDFYPVADADQPGRLIFPALYSTAEAARELGISPQRVRQLATARKVGKLVGKNLVFDEYELAKLRIPGQPGRPRKEH
jgi:hypothetical protein